MKIIFICPTWTDDLGVFSDIAKRRNSQPPLGILYLASVASKRGHFVRAIDADVESYDLDHLVKIIIEGCYDLVCITATSPIFHKAVRLAEDLKSRGYKQPVVIGGEHINIFRKTAFENCFDFGFFGESDVTFGKFLEILETGSDDFSDMKGFIYRRNGQIFETSQADRIKDLDVLIYPALNLLRIDKYVMTFAKYKKRMYLPIMASRGCPFKCVYCSEPLTNPTVRFRSAENVVDEMEKWKKDLLVSHFFFIDSNLTLDRQRIAEICELILKRNLKITFEGWTRANLVDKEILTLLRNAGLIRMSYGIESGDPEVLKIIHKEVSQESILKAIKLTDDLGIEVACSLMLGLPGDTKASVERTISFVKNIPQILYTNFSIANPYPGTKMLEWARSGKYGMRLAVEKFSDYRRYDFSPISVNDLSQSDLVRIQKIGLLKMHFTVKRIFAAVKMLGVFELVKLILSFCKRVVLKNVIGTNPEK